MPLGRETNCIPRRDQSACNYTMSHNSDLLPSRDSIVRRPCMTDTLSSMKGTNPSRIFPICTRRNERTCRFRFVQTTSRYRLRRMRGAPFPRRDILQSFCTYAERRGRRAHVLQCSLRRSPEFSDALRRSSARSPLTDRWNLDGNLGCFKSSHYGFLLASFLRTVISTKVLHVK